MQKKCSNPSVEFVDELFGESPFPAQWLEGRKTLVVADLNAVKYNPGIGTSMGAYFRAHNLDFVNRSIVLMAGERSKMDNLRSFQNVVEAALNAELGAGDAILAFGGGTILDVAGYAAAQINGGIGLVRVPTTPSAFFGGAFVSRAEMNVGSFKSAISVPSKPLGVLMCPSIATNVLDGVWRAGLAEAVRYAAIQDEAFLAILEENVSRYLEKDVTAFDKLVRALHASWMKSGETPYALDLAHRAESLTRYHLPYGYAINVATRLELVRDMVSGARPEAAVRCALALLDRCGTAEGVRHSMDILKEDADLLVGGLESEKDYRLAIQWIFAEEKGVRA